ncbi:MAG: fibronectin type III domain-containing protein [Pseudomonadota bacterium]
MAGVNKQTGNKISDVSSIYQHTGLTNSITYYYMVTAVNKYGESGESQVVSSTPSPFESPLPPSNVEVLAGDRQVVIRWLVQEAGSAITSYNIYWSTSAGVTKQSGAKISDATNPYTHMNLANGTTYYYVVTGVNVYGESLASIEVSATPSQSILSAPSGVTVKAGVHEIVVNWTAVPGATSYNLYWSTSSGVNKENGTKISDVASPYTHADLTYYSAYYYMVTAVNAYGESLASSVVSATPHQGTPSHPNDVTANAGILQVVINWTVVPEDTSYNIYWSTSAGVNKENGTKISSVTSPYTHTDLTYGTTYYYVVTGVNVYGESLASSVVSAAPRQSIPSAPSGVTVSGGNPDNEAVIRWTAVPEATSYNIYWSTSAGVTKARGTKISGVTSPYTHRSLTYGTTYFFVVTSVNAFGESLVSAEVSVTARQLIPSAPSGVSATAENRVNEAVISWTAVTGATSYNLYWSMSSDISKNNGTQIANVTSPYIHQRLTSVRTYYYVVTAVNGYGESANSNKASVIIPNSLKDIAVAMGDSITKGKGVGYDGSYVYLLSVNWGKTVYNEGVGSMTSGYGASEIDRILAQYNPKYITILYGTNDSDGLQVSWTISNLRYIIRRAKVYGTRPVIATIPPVFGDYADRKPWVLDLNRQIRQLASEEGVQCADIEAALNWDSTYMLADGLHPNIAGHSKIASTFQRALER